jgi:hypothetical protein
MNFQRLQVCVLFVLCFCLGLSLLYSTYEKPLNPRGVASQNAVYQIHSLSADEIRAHIQKQVRVRTTESGMKTISFGSFSSALCSTYSQIEVEFSAEGVAVAGEAPRMKISAPCTENRSGSIAALQFPYTEILKEKPSVREFSYNGTVVSFTNAADEWPRQWILQKVEFRNAAGGVSKAAEIQRAPASVPIVMDF